MRESRSATRRYAGLEVEPPSRPTGAPMGSAAPTSSSTSSSGRYALNSGSGGTSRSKFPGGSGSGSGGGRCSFVLLIQLCLALLCGSFLLQWWHWRPGPLVDHDDTGMHANLRGLDTQPQQHQQQQSQPPTAITTMAPTKAIAVNVPAPLEPATTTPAPATAEAQPQKRTSTPAAAAVQDPQQHRRFVPPSIGATADEIRVWRQRFDPAGHTPDQRRVADMIAWAWKGYEEYAFGHDYLDVRTMRGNGLPGHDMAITLVDSLDTLFIAGMFGAFDRATAWVKVHMHDRIHQGEFISLFETTIRNLGGLLSAHYLSGDKGLLTAAEDLGEALSPAFDVHRHGIPAKDFDIKTHRTRDFSSVAEAGSLQLEFKYLARLTGKEKYHNQVEVIMDSLFREVRETYHNGLLPVHMSASTGRIISSKVTLGANGDSYYEYLLKQWLLSGKKDEKYRVEYVRAVQGIQDELVAKSGKSELVFIGELVGGELSPKMDHLVCFVPGMLALGYIHGMPKEHLELAKQLIETCYQMYAQMESKLAPEITYFHMGKDAKEDLDVHPQDAFNLQRPETVESLMILYRVTKDEKYRQYGREIMNAFEKHCKLPLGGYMTVGNVAKGPIIEKFRNGMESFFLAETLKYLFLLFSDDPTLLPLDEIVFNTEAHPFPVAS